MSTTSASVDLEKRNELGNDTHPPESRTGETAEAEKVNDLSNNDSGLDRELKSDKDLEASHTVAPVADNKDDSDPNIVGWESADDPANPQNWKGSQKASIIAAVSLMCFITPLASSMFAPGVPLLMEEFRSTNIELSSFVVSVYVLGFAIGPLFISPLSEMYGRFPLYHASNALFIIFTVACAVSSSLNMLIGFRFLAGCVGSVPLTIGGGTIADLMPQEKRGSSMAVFALGPLLGPVIGPIAGGYLAQAKGWRWVFWVLTIVVCSFLARPANRWAILLNLFAEWFHIEPDPCSHEGNISSGPSREENKKTKE